jgi:hypothetical protein
MTFQRFGRIVLQTNGPPAAPVCGQTEGGGDTKISARNQIAGTITAIPPKR